MRSILVGCAAGLIALAAPVHAGNGAPPDPQRLETGRRVYQAQCASCHGVRGEGAPGWQRPEELPPPPHDSQGHSWKHADGMLYRIVKNGWRDPFNKTERLTMPAFDGTLSPPQIGAVIDYLKTMWTTEQRQFQREVKQKQSFPAQSPVAAGGGENMARNAPQKPKTLRS